MRTLAGHAMPPGQPRLSLSQKEVHNLTVGLALLPFPPLPVRIAHLHNPFDVETDKDAYNAFEMATTQLRQDARTNDGIVNSHSVVGAAMMFHRWRPKSLEANEMAARMDIEKQQAILRLQYNVFKTATPACCTPPSAQPVYNFFFEVTQEWIDTMSPARKCIQLEGVPNVEGLGHEHAAHIVMSHYCYSQVLPHAMPKSAIPTLVVYAAPGMPGCTNPQGREI
tara:strand:+ start:4059 stop:4730 length:672 start_codon:yes stop_codon:yes gene_type:complete